MFFIFSTLISILISLLISFFTLNIAFNLVKCDLNCRSLTSIILLVLVLIFFIPVYIIIRKLSAGKILETLFLIIFGGLWAVISMFFGFAAGLGGHEAPLAFFTIFLPVGLALLTQNLLDLIGVRNSLAPLSIFYGILILAVIVKLIRILHRVLTSRNQS